MTGPSRNDHRPADERFEDYYIPEPMSGCWLWMGSEQGSYGYGALQVNGKKMAAHRFSWERANGPIPAGMLVCHRCDVVACVNPAHLFLGTNKDNEADKVAKGRQAKGRFLSDAQKTGVSKARETGRMNGKAKLTEKQAAEILLSGDTQRVLAKRHGITQAAVSAIKRRVTWNWIDV